MTIPRFEVKWTAGRIITCVLLLVSFVLVLFPWTTISVKLMGTRYSGLDLIRAASYDSENVSSFEIKTDLYKGISNLANDAADDGVRINARRTTNAIFNILSGKLTPINTADMCSTISGFLRQMKTYLVREGDWNYLDYSDPGDRAIMNLFTDVSVKVTIAAVAMWILVIAFFLSFAWAVYSLITDRKNGLIPYGISSLVLLIVFIVLTVSLNHAVSSAGSLMDDIFGYFLPFNTSFAGMRFFHLTAAGIICVLSVAASYFLPGLVSVEVPPLPNPHIGKWKCGSCGQENSAGASFCVRCGAKKPEPPRCAKCGHRIRGGVLYCPYCGAQIEGAPDPEPVPGPNPKPDPDPIWETPESL